MECWNCGVGLQSNGRAPDRWVGGEIICPECGVHCYVTIDDAEEPAEAWIAECECEACDAIVLAQDG